MGVRRTSVIILLLALGAIAACSTSPSDEPFPIKTMIFDTSTISSAATTDYTKDVVSKKKAETCNISVYLDATKSMQGFVSGGVPGNFENVLQGLEDTAFITFSSSTFSYFRFWENPEAIDREVFRKEAFSPEFYLTSQAGDDNDATQTNLLNVLNSMGAGLLDPDKDMAIIVTDLVSTSKSDRSDITKCIDGQYLQKGYSVAFLGVQAAFSGRVYDIVANGESNSYMYSGNRPYYLVIIGGTANLESYISQLESRIFSSFPEDEYEKIIIAPQTIDASEVNNERPLGVMTEDDGYDAYINSISKDYVVAADYQDQYATQKAEYVQFFYDLTTEMKDKDTPQVSIQWNNPYKEFADSTLSLVQDGWNYNVRLAEVQGLKIDQETGELWDPNSITSIQVNNSPGNIQYGALSSKDGMITVPLTFYMQKMVQDQTYLLRMDLYATPSFEPKSYPNWVNSWSMDFSNLSNWSGDPSTFPGGTTPYLNELLSTIWDKCAAESTTPGELYIGSYFLGFVACEPPDNALAEACLRAIGNEKDAEG